MRTRLIGDGLALLAGLAFPLAFAPFELSWLAIIALAVLFGVWHNTSPRRAALRGYLFGLGQFGLGVSWVYISMHSFGGASPWAAGLLTALFAAVLALYPALAGYLARRLSSRQSAVHDEAVDLNSNRLLNRSLSGVEANTGFDSAQPAGGSARLVEKPLKSIASSPATNLLLLSPALWSLVEWLRGWLFTGFPWLQTGYSQVATPLGKLAPIAGVYGVGSLSAFIAAAFAAFVCLNGIHRRMWPIIAGVLCLGLVKLELPQWSSAAGPAFSIALVQGNIAQELKFQRDQQLRTLEQYVALTQQHWGAKVIVWPETAVPLFYQQLADSFFTPLGAAAKQHGSDLLIGVPVGGDNGSTDYYNGLISIGTTFAIYRKHHLVPFGEFLPLKPLLGFILEILQIPLSDFSAGDIHQPLLKAGGWPLLATVCYEDAFGNEGRIGLPEAAYLVNVSNDAWFGDSIAPHQHLQLARMRALETGRYMLRSTNTGVTAVVGPDGKLIKQLPLFQTGVLTADITPMSGTTPYVRWGDAPLVLILLVLVLGICWNANPFRLCRLRGYSESS